VFNTEGNYQDGLRLGKDNLEIYTSLKDSNGMAMSYTNIAKGFEFYEFL